MAAATTDVSRSSYPPNSKVLLSYEETAKDFVSHLRGGLNRGGIPTISLTEVDPGMDWRTSGIEQSEVTIVILSVGYAASGRHMDELVTIINQNESKEKSVIVVFYHVKTDDVEKLEGGFGEAFMQLAKDFSDTVVKQWENALLKAGRLTGRVVSPEQKESDYVTEIVRDVSRCRTHLSLWNPEVLIGIRRRMEVLKHLVHEHGDDNDNICGVGVCGIGGDGKSTVLKHVICQIEWGFDGCCLIEDMNVDMIDRKLYHLRDNLCQKNNKVLIALDGVDTSEQVEYLLERCGWVGCGSRVVVTTRDEDAIDMVVNSDIKVGGTRRILWRKHMVEGFNYQEARHFLNFIAFGGSDPPAHLTQALNKVIAYAQGNPFALRELCCGLVGKYTAEVWKSMVDKLDRMANRNIQHNMETSFHLLAEGQQEIFLDIACCFEGEKVDYTLVMLGACYCYPIDVGYELSLLVKKLLIATDDDDSVICIHSLHKAMAKDIVRQQSPGDASQRRMLWNHDDVRDVLLHSMGSASIEGIHLDLCTASEMDLPSSAFTGMSNLKFLKFHVSFRCSPLCGEQQHYKVRASQGLMRLPDELRLLHWHTYPLSSLHAQFNPHNLVHIHLVHSNLERLWEGTKGLPRLKWINLSNSGRLLEIPDLSEAPELESITLVCCVLLRQLHSSIRDLKKLTLLNLKDCVEVTNLPSLADLVCLETLILAGCQNLTELPEMAPNLKWLYVDEKWSAALVTSQIPEICYCWS